MFVRPPLLRVSCALSLRQCTAELILLAAPIVAPSSPDLPTSPTSPKLDRAATFDGPSFSKRSDRQPPSGRMPPPPRIDPTAASMDSICTFVNKEILTIFQTDLFVHGSHRPHSRPATQIPGPLLLNRLPSHLIL